MHKRNPDSYHAELVLCYLNVALSLHGWAPPVGTNTHPKQSCLVGRPDLGCALGSGACSGQFNRQQMLRKLVHVIDFYKEAQ